MNVPWYIAAALWVALVLGFVPGARAAEPTSEDGYQLWLRYTPVEQPWRDRYASRAAGVVALGASPVVRAAVAELETGIAGLLGAAPRASTAATAVADGSIVLGTPASSAQIAARAGALKLA